MKIIVTGGGSGGHITPLLVVARELKQLQKDAQIVYIGQKGDGLADIPAAHASIDEVYEVRAGKLRRYHGEGLKQLLDFHTMALNIRDVFYVVMGLWQSFWLLKKLRPDIIFVKGGFVGVPVGLSAALLRIPYVTHDSDALPGLANRIIARWARKHAVALPVEIYDYPREKTIMVGVPVSHEYQPLKATQVVAVREQLGLPVKGRMLLVTGGGLGAKRLNDAVAACLQELLDHYPDLSVVQLAGRKLEAGLRQQYKTILNPADQARVHVKGFVTNLHHYSGAADVIITRAGATSIAEFAAQHKACIVVPNPQLTGGHQTKNAKVLADRAAIKLISEAKLKRDDHALMPPLVELLDNPAKAALLGRRLGELSEPDSAKRLAMLLLEEAAQA
jgi:UDP-N-acetylglucosamine--N-acetylmuramyl-(pentapeptide) pyrophosphoryl-undecaprenol N-acetylglucosamine transferase